MTACTIATVLRAAAGSGTIKQSELGANFKCGVKALTGPTSYDTGGSVADLSGGAAPYNVIQGAMPIHDTGVAASIIRMARYVRATAGAPATGLVMFQDGANGASVQTAAAVDLQTVIQSWFAIGS